MSTAGSGDVCPYCMKRFSKPTNFAGVSLAKYVDDNGKSIDLQPWIYEAETGSRRLADDDELSPNLLYTKKYLNHVTNCCRNTVTELRMPTPGDELKFVNTGSLHDDRFVIYGDFETTNTKIGPMCVSCYEMYSLAVTRSEKDKIMRNCSRSGHKASAHLGCTKCMMGIFRLRKILRSQCIRAGHNGVKVDLKSNSVTKACSECEKKISVQEKNLKHSDECSKEKCTECSGRDRCDHSYTSLDTRLDPVMYAGRNISTGCF